MSSIFCLVSFLAVVSGELELVQVLLRHGDRAPSFTYPEDHNLDVDQYFPRGFSQLTHRGFDQAKELGTYLRNEYSNHLTKFNRKEYLIRSSDKDRCIETAMGLTSTLFPSEIVPVHTYSHYKEDLLLKPNSVKCQKADYLAKEDHAQLYDYMNQEHGEFFTFLSQKTGWVVDASNIKDVYNAVYRQVVNNVPQPSWVHRPISSNNQTVVDLIVELKRQVRMATFDSFEKSKLRTGYLLGQMTKDMSERAKHLNKMKMIVYASHDATLTSLMYSLGISDHQLPPYTAALIFEMHKENGKRFVKILYRTSPSSPPRVLIPKGCHNQQMCPWSSFRAFVDDRIIKTREEFNELCHMEPVHEPSLPETPKSEDLSTIATVGVVSMIDLMATWQQKS